MGYLILCDITFLYYMKFKYALISTNHEMYRMLYDVIECLDLFWLINNFPLKLDFTWHTGKLSN